MPYHCGCGANCIAKFFSIRNRSPLVSWCLYSPIFKCIFTKNHINSQSSGEFICSVSKVGKKVMRISRSYSDIRSSKNLLYMSFSHLITLGWLADVHAAINLVLKRVNYIKNY